MMRKGPDFRLCLLVCAVAIPALIAPAHAERWTLTPSMSLEESWDTNIFNAPKGGDEESDFIFRAAPRIALTVIAFQTPIRLTGSTEAEKYASHDELDKWAATQNYGLETRDPLRITPRFSLRPSARYLVTRDSTRRTLLTEGASPELPPAEIAVVALTEERTASGSLEMDYRLTPRVDLELGGAGYRRTFHGDPSLTDSTTWSGNGSIGYRVTPRFSAGLAANGSYNDFDNTADSRSYAIAVRGTYTLTEKYSLDVQAGASLVSEAGNDHYAPYGSLSLMYTVKDFRANVYGSYEPAGGSITGNTTERGTITLSLTDQFAKSWWWDLSGSFQTNNTVDDPSGADFVTYYGNGGLRHQPWESVFVSLSGNIYRQRSDNTTGDDVDRESVILQVSFAKDYKF